MCLIFSCLQVAIRIPNCVTLISGFNGFKDRHLVTQGQALRILELLICYASIITLWLIRVGFLLDSRLLVQARRYLAQEPVSFQDFSQSLCPSCLKGSHPPTHLSIPSAQWASVPSWTLAAQHPVLFPRRQRPHGHCQPRAGPGWGEKLLLSQNSEPCSADVCWFSALPLWKCFSCVSECRAGQVMLLLPHEEHHHL